MNKRTTSLAVALALSVVPLSVSSQEVKDTASAESPPAAVPSKKTCFNVRDVRSISAIEDRFVYVRCIRDQHYLLTMVNGCIGLENSIAVAVANGYNRVCSLDRGVIVYKDFDQTRRCDVLLVERVADRDAALALIAEKKLADGNRKGEEN
jgi:hypothetical protein